MSSVPQLVIWEMLESAVEDNLGDHAQPNHLPKFKASFRVCNGHDRKNLQLRIEGNRVREQGMEG